MAEGYFYRGDSEDLSALVDQIWKSGMTYKEATEIVGAHILNEPDAAQTAAQIKCLEDLLDWKFTRQYLNVEAVERKLSELRASQAKSKD